MSGLRPMETSDFMSPKAMPGMVLADCFGSEGWTSPSLPILLRGANLINTLQLMLLQADGEEILIAPAWPEGWDVEFKLHAPGNTTVEAVIRNGKVEDLKATPAARVKQFINLMQWNTIRLTKSPLTPCEIRGFYPSPPKPFLQIIPCQASFHCVSAVCCPIGLCKTAENSLFHTETHPACGRCCPIGMQ